MQQHRTIKQKYPDAILLFRVGDFYETFGEDAVLASRILGITLTKRNNGAAASSDLAGFPFHALDSYLHKLIKAGYRVAVCDQLEDPKAAKGIVRRGVTELVTPGIATHDKLLENQQNNFLAALHISESGIGVAFLDISTGEFLVAEGNQENIEKLLQTFRPAEVIFQKKFQKQFKANFGNNYYSYALESWIFDEAYARENLLKHFHVHSLKGFGIDEYHDGITAAGAILHYLRDTEHPNLQHLTAIRRIDLQEFVWMDKFTVRNLELDGVGGNTLLKAMDKTISPMGARLLRRWLLLPLRNIDKINERLNLVEFIIREVDLRNSLVQHIKQCGDLERLISKVPNKKINPRELLQVARSLQHVVQIKTLADEAGDAYLSSLSDLIEPCQDIAARISAWINENPPAVAAKGNVIRSGIDEELDELREIANGGKAYLAKLQQNEAESTGIGSLKIGFNNVFGYYLEVTNSHKGKVPDSWMRKQTLANAERYITPELKEYEEKITGAEARIETLELGIYNRLLVELQAYISPIQVNANVIAILDCIICYANNALYFKYKKPQLHAGTELVLKESRHPVIERNLPAGEPYIANDIYLDDHSQQIIILTGPNMSGKSALLRQTALITLMAHAGSFVPAGEANIPLTDKIFTRVGASDNITGGESTFMVEMNETASILNNFSSRSLILLDEIGRGTSTYDGISIAWSIAEYLHEAPQKPKTLFATHYHELNELEKQFPRIKNYHITNKESGNRIIFLRKLAPGGSTHSFGIHVAKMAGMPAPMLQRANEILARLEMSRNAHELTSEDLGQILRKDGTENIQLSIFDAHSETFDEIRKLLQATDIDQLTPVQALLKLSEIKSLLR